MKTKNIIQRNLDLSKRYFFVSSKYIPLIDSNGCKCDNCNKLISNIVTIKDKDNNFYNVGSDCADTLQSLKEDLNYFNNRDSFAEGKAVRAKIQRYIKNQNGSRWDIIDFYLWYSKENETYLVCKNRDGGKGMKKLYFPEITTQYIKDLLTPQNN